MLSRIPLLVLPLIAYNSLLLLGDPGAVLAKEVFSAQLMSGALWRFDVASLFLVFGLVMLYLEVLKATRTGNTSIIDHSLSTLVMVIFLVEFLLLKGCGTSTFVLLFLMSLFDVVAGLSVSISGARRDFGAPEHS
jgi:steroid 5-alpha reductase family enzyme